MGRPVFWKLSEYFFVDRSDNELSVTAVLGSDPGASFGDDQTFKKASKEQLIVHKVRREDEE